MALVQILCFPITKVLDPINIPPNGTLVYAFKLPRYETNWNNHLNLSETLNNQIKNNVADFEQLHQLCNIPDNRLFTTKDDVILKDYYISDEQNEHSSSGINQKIIQCNKFKLREPGYIDVLTRDNEVFNQTDWNVQTYALVLIYKNTYFGHIYAWTNKNINKNTNENTNNKICFGMGIRNRIDSVFIDNELPDVAKYLLEGVRRFGLAQGCNLMSIPNPLEIMKKILTNLNFYRHTIHHDVIGKSLAVQQQFVWPYCDNCYIYNNINLPIIEDDIEFKIYL